MCSATEHAALQDALVNGIATPRVPAQKAAADKKSRAKPSGPHPRVFQLTRMLRSLQPVE